MPLKYYLENAYQTTKDGIDKIIANFKKINVTNKKITAYRNNSLYLVKCYTEDNKTNIYFGNNLPLEANNYCS